MRRIVNIKSLPIQDEPEKIRQLIYDWDMRLIMNDEQLQTLEQVKQFLEGSEALEFRGLAGRALTQTSLDLLGRDRRQ